MSSQFEQGNFHAYINRNIEAEATAKTNGWEEAEMAAIINQSLGWGNLGDYKKALEAASRLVQVARSYNNQYYLMVGTFHVADCIAPIDARSRWKEIRKTWLEGLELARHLFDHYYVTYHLLRLGQYAVRVGEFEQGKAWLEETLCELGPGQETMRFEVHKSLTEMARKQGQPKESLRYAQIAVGVARKDGNAMFLADAKVSLAWAKWASGDPQAAQQILDEVLPPTQQGDWKYVEIEAQLLQSELKLAAGESEKAIEAARRSLELAQKMFTKDEEVRALLNLGQALLQGQQNEEARQVLKQSRKLAQERDYADHFEKANVLIASLPN
jgi:tetratricopeptide (TPR) repeat protein